MLKHFKLMMVALMAVALGIAFFASCSTVENLPADDPSRFHRPMNPSALKAQEEQRQFNIKWCTHHRGLKVCKTEN